jgi:hypothetical protein
VMNQLFYGERHLQEATQVISTRAAVPSPASVEPQSTFSFSLEEALAKLPLNPEDRERVTMTAMIPTTVIPTTASSSSGGPPSGFMSGLAPGFLNKKLKKNKKMRKKDREEADRDKRIVVNRMK